MDKHYLDNLAAPRIEDELHALKEQRGAPDITEAEDFMAGLKLEVSLARK